MKLNIQTCPKSSQKGYHGVCPRTPQKGYDGACPKTNQNKPRKELK